MVFSSEEDSFRQTLALTEQKPFNPGGAMERALCLRLTVLIAALAVSMPLTARSDVLPPYGDETEWAVLSLEGLVSLERPLGGGKSISLWGGVGSIWASADADQSWGGEVAAELRVYARDDHYIGPNCGAYVGLGLLDNDERDRRITITPGVKVTVSIQIPRAPLLVEPYLGLSYPLIKELDDGEWGFPDTPFMTLGFRLVVRHLCAWYDDGNQPGNAAR
jgi:hypothetical protein